MKLKEITFWALTVFIVLSILSLLGFNTFLNYRNNQYYEEKRSKLESSQSEEDEQLDRDLKKKQKEILDGWQADKGKILSVETVDESIGIQDLEYDGQDGQLIFPIEIRKHFLAILEDLEDIKSDGAVDVSKDEYQDPKDSIYLKRRNTVLYGYPGTGKTCFIDELFWKIEEKFGDDVESIDPNNPNASILQQQENKKIPPIFKIDGVELQTGGVLVGQPDSYKKFIAMVKHLKKNYFGDEYSDLPYIVFVEEADQGVNVANKEKGKLLEDWKNFLSTNEDKMGFKSNAQDPNSVIIIATNNYENIDQGLFRRGRLGKKLNFNWTPQLLKEYGEKKFNIRWPTSKQWDFKDSKDYENLYNQTSRFGYTMAKNEFAEHARKIISSYNSLKDDEKKAKEEELGKKTTGKKIKNKDGKDEDEMICNWLLHYLYTFYQFNYRQDLDSFTSAEQIQRFDYGKEVLLREKLLSIQGSIAIHLNRISGKLQELKEEASAQELRGLRVQAEDVKNMLLLTESHVKILHDQVVSLGNSNDSVNNLRGELQNLQNKVNGLQTKLNNLPVGGSAGSSASVEQMAKEAVRKITQKLNEL